MGRTRRQITLRRVMILVAIIAILTRPAVWLWEEYQGWRAYAEWAGNPKRTGTYHIPPKSIDNPWR